MKIRLAETRDIKHSKRVVEKSRDEWVSVWSGNHKGSTKTLENNIKYVGTVDDIKETFGMDELASNGVVRFGLYLASDKTVNHDTGEERKSRDEWTKLNKTQPEKYLTQIRLYGFYDKLLECVENKIVNKETISKVLDAMWKSDNYDGICECEDAKKNKGSNQFGKYACKHVIFLGDLHKHTKTYNNVKKDLIGIICDILKTSRKFEAFCGEHDFEIQFEGSTKETKNENVNKYSRYRNNVMEDYEDIIVDVSEDYEDVVDEYTDEYTDEYVEDDVAVTDEYTQGESTFDTNALYADCNTVLEAIQNDTVLSCHGVQVTDIIDRIDRVNEGEIVDDIDRKFVDLLLSAIATNETVTTDEDYEDEYDFDEDSDDVIDEAEIEYESRCGVRRKENGRYCKHCNDDYDVVNENDYPFDDDDDYDDVYSDDYFNNDGDDFARNYVSDYSDDGYGDDDYNYRPVRRRRVQW